MVEKTLLFPTLVGLGTLAETQLTVNTQVYFWTPSSVSVSVFMQVLRCFGYSNFVLSCKTGNVEPFSDQTWQLLFLLCPLTTSFSLEEVAEVFRLGK